VSLAHEEDYYWDLQGGTEGFPGGDTLLLAHCGKPFVALVYCFDNAVTLDQPVGSSIRTGRRTWRVA